MIAGLSILRSSGKCVPVVWVFAPKGLAYAALSGQKVKKPPQSEFTAHRYCAFSSCRYSFAG